MTTTEPRNVEHSKLRVNEIAISADSHVLEPTELWEQRMPAKFRDQLPPLPNRPNDQAGATDPADRLGAMKTDGVSMEVLYPTYGLMQFSLTDAELQEAAFRVYNDWIAEYRSVTPDRLVAIPMISSYNIDHAIAELERCTAAGSKGALLWHVPPEPIGYTTDHYDRLWAAAQEMGAPINLHILSGFSYRSQERLRGTEQYRTSVEFKTLDAIHQLFNFIYYGVLDRFPELKLVLVEFEIGWIPWLLQQWDYYVKRHQSRNNLGLSLLPSEYFERQVFATFVHDNVGAQLLNNGWGVRNCMWSSDFPHGFTSWPHSRQVIDDDLGDFGADARARLLRENVTELYDVPIPTSIFDL